MMVSKDGSGKIEAEGRVMEGRRTGRVVVNGKNLYVVC